MNHVIESSFRADVIVLAEKIHAPFILELGCGRCLVGIGFHKRRRPHIAFPGIVQPVVRHDDPREDVLPQRIADPLLRNLLVFLDRICILFVSKKELCGFERSLVEAAGARTGELARALQILCGERYVVLLTRNRGKPVIHLARTLRRIIAHEVLSVIALRILPLRESGEAHTDIVQHLRGNAPKFRGASFHGSQQFLILAGGIGIIACLEICIGPGLSQLTHEGSVRIPLLDLLIEFESGTKFSPSCFLSRDRPGSLCRKLSILVLSQVLAEGNRCAVRQPELCERFPEPVKS